MDQLEWMIRHIQQNIELRQKGLMPVGADGFAQSAEDQEIDALIKAFRARLKAVMDEAAANDDDGDYNITITTRK